MEECDGLTQATRSNRRGNKNMIDTSPESRESFLPLGLETVTMDGHDTEALTNQVRAKEICLLFHLNKHQHFLLVCNGKKSHIMKMLLVATLLKEVHYSSVLYEDANISHVSIE